MRKITCLLIAVCATILSASYGQSPIIVNTKPQNVTVYLSGVEMSFKETILLKPGENSIQFKGLSSSLVTESAQVAVSNNVEVISVSSELEQQLPHQVNPKLTAMQDSITLLEDKITIINNQIDAYQMERQTLAQNQRIASPTGGVLLQELTKAADFFRERTLKINNSLMGLNKSLKLLSEKLVVTKGVYDKEVSEIDLSRYSINVVVLSKESQSANFLVRYLATEAEWQATYDIVAAEVNKPVTLKYKAQIYNNTGIDWKDVKLSLSTGDISLSASRPYLTAWILNYSSNANEGFVNAMAQNVMQTKTEEAAVEERAASELNTTFDIEQRHSIQSGGRPYHISLSTETLQASFEYLAIPKMELSAFLLAKVTGWEKLNLIDGIANVYYGNTYIGESSINTRLIGDTLELSLGRDNQVVVSRTKVEDKGNTPVIGGKRSEFFIYEIRVRNNRNVPVGIRVQDQIPVSQENDIMVEVSDISNAVLDGPSGRIQWFKNLPPSEVVKYEVAFAVKYPKNKTVNIRKSRVVRTPRYRK
jgi:uncharacterized protein (TIGR02231 family)